MADKTRDAIAALEAARAQVETVLAGNASWLALNRAGGSSRLALELAFAADPLYRSWRLLNEAIGDLQTKEAPQDPTEDKPPTASVIGAPTGAGAGTHDPQLRVALVDPRSIDLHHVLQYIRDTAARSGDRAAPADEPPGGAPAPAATASDDADGRGAAAPAGREDDTSREAADAMSGWEGDGDPASEVEEATVTFVIREDASPASADAGPPEAVAYDGPASDRWARVEEADSLYAPTGDQVEEAEVAIVPRRPGLRPRRA